MTDRYFIALSYGLSWLVLGWGIYAFIRIGRGIRNVSTLTFSSSEHTSQFCIGDILNTGEIVTWRNVKECRIYTRKATWFWRGWTFLLMLPKNTWMLLRQLYFTVRNRIASY